VSASERAFSSDYDTARARFREAARRARFEISATPIGQKGPSGSELTIDFAQRGPTHASRVLVISSGLHGIEGYFGSAVQWTWLEQHTGMLAPGQRVILIHALNPYGFAHRRRVNEDNVDLNRNFVLEGAQFSGSHASYRALNPLLNPEQPPKRVDTFLLQAVPQLARHGFSALKNAVAQGQYEFPKGLFFGGQAPTTTSRILRNVIPSLVGSPEHVIHIDLHTGRGKSGEYALAVDMPMDSPRVQMLRRTFGGHIEGFDAASTLYEIRGALGPWLDQLMPLTQYDCLLAEFGTYNALSVLRALRLENAAHFWAPEDAELRERSKARLMEAFCPRSARWRADTLGGALRVITQAVRATT
jgi:predicted deacylase